MHITTTRKIVEALLQENSLVNILGIMAELTEIESKRVSVFDRNMVESHASHLYEARKNILNT